MADKPSTSKPETQHTAPAPPAPAVPRPGVVSASGSDVLSGAPVTAETEQPPSHASRSLALPTRYWENLDRVAERAGISVDVWLERYLLNQVGR